MDEISRSGGVACSNYDSVLDGEKIIETALARYGGIHILINNEPFNPKFTMEQVTDNIWDSYMELRLNGPYKVHRELGPCRMPALPFSSHQYSIFNLTHDSVQELLGYISKPRATVES